MTPARPRTHRDDFAWWKRLAFWRRFLALKFALYCAFAMVREGSRAAVWLEQNLDVLEQALATLLALSTPEPGVEPAEATAQDNLPRATKARIAARIARISGVLADPAPHVTAMHARMERLGIARRRGVTRRPPSPIVRPPSPAMTPSSAMKPAPADTS